MLDVVLDIEQNQTVVYRIPIKENDNPGGDESNFSPITPPS